MPRAMNATTITTATTSPAPESMLSDIRLSIPERAMARKNTCMGQRNRESTSFFPPRPVCSLFK